jgi:hypothetical protein
MTGLSKQSGHFWTFRVTRTGMLSFFFAPLIQSFRQPLLPQILINKNRQRHSLFSPRKLSSAANKSFFPYYFSPTPTHPQQYTLHCAINLACCCRFGSSRVVGQAIYPPEQRQQKQTHTVKK